MEANFTRPVLSLDESGQKQQGDWTNDPRASRGDYVQVCCRAPGERSAESRACLCVCAHLLGLRVRLAISVLFLLMSRVD